MADATTIVEGKIKFREGKKWKPRWCILKKPSPVADQLQVVLYKDVTQAVKDEAKPKNTFVLEAFFGLDAGVTFDKEPHVLAVICQRTTILMGFEQREQMIQFEIKIRQSLGEEHQFPVTVVKAPSSSRLLKEQVRLVIHDLRFCLIAQTPPKILLSWNIEDLRRFGTNENKFCFEGGSRCGKGTGVFALQSEQAKDIEDIVHLASIGKMSNGHRKSKIRSSQVDLSTHLIADILPSHSSYIHHHHQNTGSKSPPQAPLPVTLNCCYDNQTGSAESEDWSWYKRHSVSVMDHHRIVASRDNNMDHFMGIYDVPPNHGRRLADNIGDGQEEPAYAVPRAYLESAQPGSPQNSNNDYSNCNKKRSIDGHAEDQNRFKGADDGFTLRVNDTASKSPSPSASREESLQRLKMQESDLQREMVLLDEILQNCAAKNPEKVFELDKNDQTSTEMKSSKSHKSPLTSLDDHLTIISGNISPFSIKLENPQAPKRTERVMAERLNTSMPEQMPSSPLCKRKSKNILAPLPYVNLSRYDDESYSHVHLPGSSDSIPIARDSNHMGLDVKQVRLRGQSSSLINLTHSSAHQVSGKPYYGGSSSGSMVHYGAQQSTPTSKHMDHQEILVVKLDDTNVSDPVVYASLQCMVPDDNTNPNNDLMKVLMSDAGRPMHEETYINCEAIYENLPFRIDNTLPPELPPKGPALLNKLKAASSLRQMPNNINPQPPIQCGYRTNDINNFHSAAERSYNGHKSNLHVSSYDVEQEKKIDLKEDNYCLMGSPKVQHKLSVIPESPFKSTKSHCQQSQFKSPDIHVKSDYMDMGVIGSDSFEDEIYLDVDVTRNAKDLYISEADLKLASNMSGESTYMDMSCVPNRKSIVVPNLDAIYVIKTPLKETSRQNQRTKLGPAPPPPCPPRPPSFKKTLNVENKQKSNHTAETDVNQELKSSQIKSQPVKSSTKVYTKVKKSNQSEAPMPFPNLMDFTKKLSESRSTYVNTFIDSDRHCANLGEPYNTNRDVQLPEPAKEGFLARFKRRSSKDKNALQTPEKSNKNRNSVLERSLSEHETSKAVKDEKTSKLKLGRRRSSSFPNRLSYQEALDTVAGLSHAMGSCGSFVSGSSKPSNTGKQAEPNESSSIQDISDDSDMSPLLKRGDKKQDSHTLTVLHVHQGSSNPLYPYMQISKSVTAQGGSSKTDDEKLIEMIQQKNNLKKPVIYQRSSSLELKSPVKDADQTFYLKISKPSIQSERKLSFEKLVGCTNASHSSSLAACEDPSKPLDMATPVDEHLPPALPPKLKSYQVPLSPVLETSPPIPATTEPLYVELDEVVITSRSGEDVGRKESRQEDGEREMR